MSTRSSLSYTAIACTLLTISMLPVGCESSRSSAGLDDAIRAYDSADYDTARERAGRVLADSRSGRRYEAAYVAGMSSYQLGYVDEAERRLEFATKSNASDVRGRAEAMLGRIRLDQRRYVEAESLLTSAATRLDGADARRARELAASARSGVSTHRTTDDLPATTAYATTYAAKDDAMAGAGNSYYGSAEESMQVNEFSPPYSASNPASPAYGSVPPPAVRPVAAPMGRFTLQAGAYRELDRAEVAARQAEAIAAAHGLGRVTIVPREDVRGRTLYLVQFGSFTTRMDAGRRRDRIGDLEIIVTQSTG
jgi:hypothetical protein